jgi:hypothetical protein
MNDEIRAAGAIAKDAVTWSSQWLLLMGAMFLAIWGGLVRVSREVKVGEHSWKMLVWIFVREMLTSGFTGVMTYFACQAIGIPPAYTAILVGISGWMGVRALTVFESMFKSRFKGE